MPEVPGQQKSQSGIASHVSTKLGRHFSRSTIGNLMRKRKLFLSQADYPNSKKKKLPKKLMCEDQIRFEDELDAMVSDGFSIASINLNLVVTFAAEVIEKFPVKSFTIELTEIVERESDFDVGTENAEQESDVEVVIERSEQETDVQVAIERTEQESVVQVGTERTDVEEVVVVPKVAKLPKAFKQLTIANFLKKTE